MRPLEGPFDPPFFGIFRLQSVGQAGGGLASESLPARAGLHWAVAVLGPRAWLLRQKWLAGAVAMSRPREEERAVCALTETFAPVGGAPVSHALGKCF